MSKMPTFLSSKLFTLGAFALCSMAQQSVVGWDTYRQFDLSVLRPNETASQFSSYDRNGGNDDRFEDTHTCLYLSDAGRCVIADYSGPGEVGSVWFTYFSDSIEPAGDIQIILDGVTVVEGDLQSIVNGELGAPFVWPLVGNTGDTRGGNVIKVPMPFKESMLVSTANNPHFYHVTFRKFPSADGVTLFDPAEKGDDVLTTMKRFGSVDPKPEGEATVLPTSVFSVDAGESSAPLEFGGSGTVTQLDLRIPGLVRAPHVQDDGRAFGKNGGSCMSFTVDPAAGAIRIIRRVDQSIGNQVVSVTLDDTAAKDWESGPEAAETWLDQVLETAVEKGTSSVKLCNTFKSSDVDINEFYYTVHSQVGERWILTDRLDVGPTNLNDELAHSYTIEEQTWEGLRWYNYPVSEEDLNRSFDIISEVYVNLTFDGHETVRAPLGSFFGTGLGYYDVRSLLMSVDATENGTFTSWWPMPFATTASFSLENLSGQSITNATLDVKIIEEDLSEDLQPGGTRGYFSTAFNRGDTVDAVPWDLLVTTGRGIAYGVTQTFRGYITEPVVSLGYLEGDEMIWVNGDTDATVLGTGTEDFYESGWYFAFPGTDQAGVPYNMPVAGMTGHKAQELGCAGECVSAYRLLLSDPVAFDSEIVFNIEHGSNNNVLANYESVAYYYIAFD